MKIKNPPKPDPGLKQLPPNTVLKLNEGKSVARMLPDVEKALEMFKGQFGPTSLLANIDPWNPEARKFDARMRTAAQAFGRYMEGGVLRKEDEEKYRKMFPNLLDTDETKKNKLAIIRRMLNSKYEDDRKTLEASGYDVSGFEKLEIPASIFESKKQSVEGQPTPDEAAAELKKRGL